MGRIKYTKEDLETRCYAQLQYLEVLGRRIQLLERQNEFLVKFNHKLVEELSDRKPPVPYVIKRTTNRKTLENLAAEID